MSQTIAKIRPRSRMCLTRAHRGVDNASPAVIKGSCPPGTYAFAPGSLTNQCDMYHFWSPHAGGAYFLFADGSAHFLPY
jgi:prepilin-type processing-associated H-X9-DG protein